MNEQDFLSVKVSSFMTENLKSKSHDQLDLIIQILDLVEIIYEKWMTQNCEIFSVLQQDFDPSLSEEKIL